MLWCLWQRRRQLPNAIEITFQIKKRKETTDEMVFGEIDIS